MRTSLTWLLAAGLLAGCVTASTVPLGEPIPRPVVPWEQVRVFLDETDVPGPFEKVALIKAEGQYEWANNRELVDKLRKEAGKAGANAIILAEVKEPSDVAKVADAVLGVPAKRKIQVLAISYLPAERRPGP
ncbi:MAG: hypothetical protein FIB01_14035 [Gemmatimonadetes bacterium]|nr:hypothetical protein [Gemmatimonadota bacterium]